MVLILLFIFGVCIGSFLNVVIDRSFRGESLLGRSYCESCKRHLSGIDLIPLFSFLFLKGKCRACKVQLSLFYPLVELTTGVMFVVVYGITNYKLQIASFSEFFSFVLLLFVISSLIAIFFADLKYGIIPDIVLYPLTGFTLFYQFLILKSFILNPLLAGVGAFLFFLTLYLITRGRGIGFGDVKYAFFMGLFLGFPAIVSGLYVAFLTGALVSLILVLLAKKKLRGGTVPFGPFLVIGTFVGWWWGAQILKIFFGV